MKIKSVVKVLKFCDAVRYQTDFLWRAVRADNSVAARRRARQLLTAAKELHNYITDKKRAKVIYFRPMDNV